MWQASGDRQLIPRSERSTAQDVTLNVFGLCLRLCSHVRAQRTTKPGRLLLQKWSYYFNVHGLRVISESYTCVLATFSGCDCVNSRRNQEVLEGQELLPFTGSESHGEDNCI